MTAALVGLSDGVRIPVDKPIILLGRDAECDIQFKSRKISRRHCCIAQVGDRLVIRDLGSTNGIRINGVRVGEGYLKAGDELAIGSFRYEVRWDADSENTRKPAKRSAKKDLSFPTDNDNSDVEIVEELPERSTSSRRPPPTPRPQREETPASESVDDSSKTAAAGESPRSQELPDEIGLVPVTDEYPPLSPRGRGKPPQS